MALMVSVRSVASTEDGFAGGVALSMSMAGSEAKELGLCFARGESGTAGGPVLSEEEAEEAEDRSAVL